LLLLERDDAPLAPPCALRDRKIGAQGCYRVFAERTE
jgi:hypothetical protein